MEPLFPGHQAGASLKPATTSTARPSPGRLFPGHQAGASLKQGRCRRGCQGWSPLPRSPSRGLIEAAIPPRSGPQPRSLPRSPSRGLIEAGPAQRGGHVSRRALFPGHQAGASLKRFSYVLMPRFRRLFPGHQAGASLKPDVRGGGLGGRRLFPGHQAGASLKRPTGWTSTRATASEALPRSPSRGLIEAEAYASRRKPWYGLFPGHQAGASLKRRLTPADASRGTVSSPVTKPGPH